MSSRSVTKHSLHQLLAGTRYPQIYGGVQHAVSHGVQAAGAIRPASHHRAWPTTVSAEVNSVWRQTASLPGKVVTYSESAGQTTLQTLLWLLRRL